MSAVAPAPDRALPPRALHAVVGGEPLSTDVTVPVMDRGHPGVVGGPAVRAPRGGVHPRLLPDPRPILRAQIGVPGREAVVVCWFRRLPGRPAVPVRRAWLRLLPRRSYLLCL